MPLFSGVGVALVTLFRPDGALDAPATAEHAARLAGLGVRCILAAGTTGEAATLTAAEFVFATPGLAVWQFPLETYRSCAYSVAELEADLAGSGRVGEWLWTCFTELPLPDFVRLGGVWPLGDSPPVLVTALDDESSTYRETPTGRVYTAVDVRLLVADLLAKLRLHERRR